MLTEEDKKFLEYWRDNRDREKKLFRQLATGLPIGCTLAIAILLSLFSGWYQRADMVAGAELNPNVLIIALLVIIVFIAIFSKKHRWDMNEERYLELLNKNKKENQDSANKAKPGSV